MKVKSSTCFSTISNTILLDNQQLVWDNDIHNNEPSYIALPLVKPEVKYVLLHPLKTQNHKTIQGDTPTQPPQVNPKSSYPKETIENLTPATALGLQLVHVYMQNHSSLAPADHLYIYRSDSQETEHSANSHSHVHPFSVIIGTPHGKDNSLFHQIQDNPQIWIRSGPCIVCIRHAKQITLMDIGPG